MEKQEKYWLKPPTVLRVKEKAQKSVSTAARAAMAY